MMPEPVKRYYLCYEKRMDRTIYKAGVIVTGKHPLVHLAELHENCQANDFSRHKRFMPIAWQEITGLSDAEIASIKIMLDAS